MIDPELWQQFRGGIQQLPQMGQRTDMPDAERVKRAKATFLNKINENAAVDLEACIHCGQCAEACHFYATTQDPKYTPIRKLDILRRFYRREMGPFRWLFKFFSKDITAQELEESQELVFDSCTECGRCSMICPMGIDIAGMVGVMREGLASADLIPDELRAVEQEQGGRGSIFGIGPDQLKEMAEKLTASGLNVPVDKEHADVMVVSTVMDIFLFHDALKGTAQIMNHLGLNWTIRSCGFEASNFGLLSGHDDVQRTATLRIIDEAIACGAKTVIVPECGHAYPALRWVGANVYGKPLPFEVYAISEFIGREVKAGRLKVQPIGSSKKITFHDPCKVSRGGGATQESRDALNALGVDLHETDPHGEMNWCCGGGAGVTLINRAAPLRRKVFDLKVKQIEATGADSLVTSCASCRINFLVGKEDTGWDKPVESLVELIAANLAE